MRKFDPTDIDRDVPFSLNLTLISLGLLTILCLIAAAIVVIAAAIFLLGGAWTAGAFVVTALAHLPLPADVI